MTNLQILLLALALAFLTESMVEYLFGQAVDHIPAMASWRWALMYIAAVAGVGLAFYYRLDLLALIGQLEPSPVGFALSGLIIGRGANYLHDFVSRYILQQQFPDPEVTDLGLRDDYRPDVE